MKKFVLFICLFFCFYSVSGATLTMSPPQIDFIDSGCSNVTIGVDGLQELEGKILWAEKGFGERKLSRHVYTNSEMEINFIFPKNLTAQDQIEIEVCIEDGVPGKYHGVLLYKIKNKPVQVGIWVTVEISGNGIQKLFLDKTGENNENLIRKFYYTSILLILILLGLAMFSRVKKLFVKPGNLI